MSRKKVFFIVFAVVFLLGALAFWRSSEMAFYGFMAAVIEGNRDGSGYFLGWLFGTGIPALVLGWIASLVFGHVKKSRQNNDPEDDVGATCGTES